MFPHPVAAEPQDPPETHDPLFVRSIGLAQQPPAVRRLIYTLRIAATIVTVLVGTAVAAVLWTWPWEADGAIAIVVAAAWCGWLNAPEVTR